MRFLIIIGILFFVASCSNTGASDRELFWKGALTEYDPIGKTRPELWKFLHGDMDVVLDSFPRGENGDSKLLESLSGDGLICSKWDIFLSAEYDDQGMVTSWVVSSVGSCL